MRRLTMEALETLAFAQRRLIEVDNEQGIAVVELRGQTYYAQLPLGDRSDEWTRL